MGSEGCPSCNQIAFSVWEDSGVCPHCGSEDLEFDVTDGYAYCCDCRRESAAILTDDMELETWLLNNLDRFDYQDIVDQDRVGGD